MTMAVCFKCGAIKFGAFVPCPECQGMPGTEDELALSLGMTDHYFDMPTLEKMGEAIKAGTLPQLSPETREQLVANLREFGLLDKLRTLAVQPKADDPIPPN